MFSWGLWTCDARKLRVQFAEYWSEVSIFHQLVLQGYTRSKYLFRGCVAGTYHDRRCSSMKNDGEKLKISVIAITLHIFHTYVWSVEHILRYSIILNILVQLVCIDNVCASGAVTGNVGKRHEGVVLAAVGCVAGVSVTVAYTSNIYYVPVI